MPIAGMQAQHIIIDRCATWEKFQNKTGDVIFIL
jgi:hypothetical protein